MQTAQDLIGRTIQGKFVMTDVLGEGAMGIVYRGFDQETLAEVAIKVLQPSLAENQELVSRFHREAAATRRVDHESTVQVLGRGCEEGLNFLVMELLRGRSLAAVLAEQRRMPEGRAARLVIQLCGALSVAHQRGVVHRDIKPDNVMVIEGTGPLGERVKLLDFGIAKRVVAPPQPGASGAAEDSFSSGDETRAGALIGTPEYMSPEQCMGRDVDQRTDVYACGVLLYRLVTGEVPFDGQNAHPFELCQRHIGEAPRSPRDLAPWLSDTMVAIIDKALRKAPDDRQQSAAQLRDELAVVLAAIASVEMERTEPVSLDALGLTLQGDLLAEDLAVPVAMESAPADDADRLPTLALDERRAAPVIEAAAPILTPAADDDDPDAFRVVAIAPITLRAATPVFTDSTTQVTATRQRRRKRGLNGYLPTVALAAVIGAGVGSLIMALAPFMHR